MKFQVATIRHAIKGLKPTDTVEIKDGRMIPNRQSSKPGPRPGTTRMFNYEEAKDMSAAGMTNKAIAFHFGVSRQAVASAFKRMGEV